MKLLSGPWICAWTAQGIALYLFACAAGACEQVSGPVGVTLVVVGMTLAIISMVWRLISGR